MRKLVRAAALAAFWMISATQVSALERVGPARIVDADTLVIGPQVIRLEGIDAPETAQRCHGRPCGAAATDALAALIGGTTVRCTGSAYDAYDRLIATCHAAGHNLNAALVEHGHAAAFRRYSLTYVPQEDRARAARRGMWAGGMPQMPWEFRAARWTASTQLAPDPACPIKGNISDRGRIYHTPWSPYYGRTRINTGQGERWFCTEAEALAAGWRAPVR